MFGTIRRHQKWLWIVVAGITILSFVVFGPTNTRMANSLANANASDLGKINGRKIEVTEFEDARKEVYLDYFLNSGQWPDDPATQRSNFDPTKETYFRLLFISKQKELGIAVSTESITDFARQVLNAFHAESPDVFEERLLKPRGMTMGDVDRCLRRKMAIQQMMGVAGLSGKLVTPQEAEELYRKEHEELNSAMVYFSASNFLASVTVTPEALAQYYSNRQAAYVIPKRVQVDYVKFNVTNYLAEAKTQVTNLNAIVEEEYRRYGTNAAMLAKSPEEAKVKLGEEIIHKQAGYLAQRAANAFSAELDTKEPKNLSTFAALAKAKGLTEGTTEPFDQDNGPKDWDVTASFNKKAFALTTEDPFTGAVPVEDGAYVLAFNKVLPSEIPPLKEVEAKVSLDYRMAMAAQAARQAGGVFASSLTNGIGKSFEAVAAESHYKSETLPAFTLSTQKLPADLEERLDIRLLKDVGFSTGVGKVSPFVPTRDGGLVLYVQSRSPVDESLVKKEMPEYLNYIRQVRQGDAFNQWFNNQIRQDPEFQQKLIQISEDKQKQNSLVRRPAS